MRVGKTGRRSSGWCVLSFSFHFNVVEPHTNDVYFVPHQAFDALIHFSFEGSFLYLSTFGRSVNASQGPFASLWKEYARADFRWGFSDPTVVSLEILTVLGAGPLCCFILYQLTRQDAARHYWIVVLSTAELYGGWMTFCPEWLTGSPNLDTSNPLYLYVYLTVSLIIFALKNQLIDCKYR